MFKTRFMILMGKNKNYLQFWASDRMTLDNLEKPYLTKRRTVLIKNGEPIFQCQKIGHGKNLWEKIFLSCFITASKSVYTLEMNVSGIK